MESDQAKHKRSKWILILVAAVIICGLWFLLNPGTDTTPSQTEKSPPIDSDESGFQKMGAVMPAREGAADTAGSGADRDLPAPLSVSLRPPAYTRASEMTLNDYEAGAEYVIVGCVMTDKEVPIPGATVTLYASVSPRKYELQDPLIEQICDDRGRYKIQLAAPLEAHIGVKAKGYARVEDSFSLDQPGIIVKNYRLQEAKAGIEGYVFDLDGKPIMGAWVYVSLSKTTVSGDFSHVSIPIAETDATGRYVIHEIPEGEIERKVGIAASSRFHLPEGKTVQVKAGQYERVDFRLRRARTISFLVKTRSGRPLPGASAYVAEIMPHFTHPADETGRLEFLVPPEVGQLTCTVKAKGFKAVTLTFDPAFPPAEVRLDEGPLFRGRVLSESGRALAGVKVSVVGTGGRVGQTEGSVLTDGAGAFSVPLSFPPVFRVSADKAGYLEYHATFDPENAPLNLEIRMRRIEGGIYGRVIDETGSPVSRFTVSLWPKPSVPGARGYHRSFDNSPGVFSITDLPAGFYTIKVQSVGLPVSIWRSNHLEIRKGYYWGELLVELAKTR